MTDCLEEKTFIRCNEVNRGAGVSAFQQALLRIENESSLHLLGTRVAFVAALCEHGTNFVLEMVQIAAFCEDRGGHDESGRREPGSDGVRTVHKAVKRQPSCARIPSGFPHRLRCRFTARFGGEDGLPRSCRRRLAWERRLLVVGA